MTDHTSQLRTLLIYAVVLPLALMLGYLWALPLDKVNLGIMGAMVGFLCLPLILRWHNPLLILTWNATAMVPFVSGRPQFWLVLSFLGLGIALFQRALVRGMRFVSAPSVAFPLVYLALVVLGTARLTGGIGMSIFGGGGNVGGSRYLLIMGAIAGFWAIIAHRIPRDRALFYVGLFFLGGVSNAIGSTASFVPSWMYIIFQVFAVTGGDLGAAGAETVAGAEHAGRYFGLSIASRGLICYLLARYGIMDPLARRRFLPLLMLVACVMAGALGGFRSYLILIGLTVVIHACLEGFFRSRLAIPWIAGALLAGVLIIPFSDKLPLAFQRSLCFLPLKVNPSIRAETEASSEWRVEMWKVVLPEVPKYFWLGKGYSIDSGQMELIDDLAKRGKISTQEVAVLAGDYHNGPLTVIIPFGIWGAIGWLWFLGASIRALYRNYRHCDGSVRTLNTLLFAYFIAKLISFFAVFGSFHAEFASFTGIVALSLSLNGGICRPAPGRKVVQSIPIRIRAPRSSQPQASA